jgi:phage/plasmid-like protein (TIGR03299 family)
VGDENIDSKTAIIKAGLNWTVSKRNLYAADASGKPSSIPVDSNKAIVRDTDNTVLGVVGHVYTPVQNLEAFNFMDALVEDGDLRYHTAGSLRSGQRIWLLAQFGRSEVVPKDVVDKFLFLWNTHDGSGKLRCLFTNTRVVCANTARSALMEGAGEGFSFKHTTNVKNRIEEAREVLGLARQESKLFDERAKGWAKMKMPVKKWELFSEKLIPNPEDEEVSKTRAENARSQLTHLFHNGVGQDIPGVRGTGWAAYNAVVEYANFFRSARSQDIRFETSLTGIGDNLIQQGVRLLNQMKKAA